MARVNVYLPDPLARAVREAGINVSRIAQEALAGVLAARDNVQGLDVPTAGLAAAAPTAELLGGG
ncbi:MAG: type II toxin-antitoxin system CcdA family antitoxin [Actinomycetota bacterium]|nr:type II toxin-antitoxin system CcdA family antitoxin [Actinomycetota bacterium]